MVNAHFDQCGPQHTSAAPASAQSRIWPSRALGPTLVFFGQRGRAGVAALTCSAPMPFFRELSRLVRLSAPIVCIPARFRGHDGRSRGFALLIVLWSLVLIAFIVAHVAASGRTEIRIAENLVVNAAASAAADGAIWAAIFNQSDPKLEQRWPLEVPHEVDIGRSRVMLQLRDEASWINPNTAPPALLEALLRTTGSDPANARTLAAAIAEWVGVVAVARPQNQIFADYRAARLSYGPPGAPLQTIDELGRVLGMTPAVLAAVRPHLTLFGPPQPNPHSSDPIIADAVAQLPVIGVLPPVNPLPPDLATTRITATAIGPGNARISRTAIVRFGAMLPRSYEALYWGRAIE
jgi:general secretion pathway protein K